MKRVALVCGIILIALSIMAPGPPEQAEKLTYDNEDWDFEPSYLGLIEGEYLYGVAPEGLDGLLCKFGLATAGEHADFTIGVTFSGVRYDEEGWDYDWSTSATAPFQKAPGALKDEDGYIAIELTDALSWNGDDDGDGYIVNEVAISLLKPNGEVLGESFTVDTGGTVVRGGTFAEPLMIDDEGWDYAPEPNEMTIPLLADRFLIGEGIFHAVADLSFKDLSGAATGTAFGGTLITFIGEPIPGYMQIEPIVTNVVDWNGDDDGTEIVSGTLSLVDEGGVEVHSMVFTDIEVDLSLP